MPTEISDNSETIKRASQASGARKMIEELAKKIRKNGTSNGSIDS